MHCCIAQCVLHYVTASPPNVQKQKKIKLANSLSKCVNYVQSVHFKGFEAVVARTSTY